MLESSYSLVNKELDIIFTQVINKYSWDNKLKHLSIALNVINKYSDLESEQIKKLSYKVGQSFFSILEEYKDRMNSVKSYPDLEEKFFNLLDFIYAYKDKKDKNSLTYTNQFLYSIKNCLVEERLNILIKKYALPYNTSVYREYEFLQKVTLMESFSIENAIPKLRSLIEHNMITEATLNKMYEKGKINILLFNLKFQMNWKITEKDIKEVVFEYWDKIKGKPNDNLIDNFCTIFSNTDVFKNSFAHMNDPGKAIKKYLNLDEMTNWGDKDKVIQAICNYKLFQLVVLSNKIERKQKIEIFNKPYLNDEEKEKFIELKNKLKQKTAKRNKI